MLGINYCTAANSSNTSSRNMSATHASSAPQGLLIYLQNYSNAHNHAPITSYKLPKKMLVHITSRNCLKQFHTRHMCYKMERDTRENVFITSNAVQHVLRRNHLKEISKPCDFAERISCWGRGTRSYFRCPRTMGQEIGVIYVLQHYNNVSLTGYWVYYNF